MHVNIKFGIFYISGLYIIATIIWGAHQIETGKYFAGAFGPAAIVAFAAFMGMFNCVTEFARGADPQLAADLWFGIYGAVQCVLIIIYSFSLYASYYENKFHIAFMCGLVFAFTWATWLLLFIPYRNIGKTHFAHYVVSVVVTVLAASFLIYGHGPLIYAGIAYSVQSLFITFGWMLIRFTE